MERLARPLLIALLAWVLTLSTGAVTGYAQGLTCRCRTGQGHTGPRPYIPGKKGTILSRDDRAVNPSQQPQLPVPGTPPAGLAAVTPAPRAGLCLLPPSGTGESLYLSLRVLLL